MLDVCMYVCYVCICIVYVYKFIYDTFVKEYIISIVLSKIALTIQVKGTPAEENT